MMRRIPRELLTRVIDYLFPPLCIVCDAPRPASDKWLCTACAERLRRNYERRDPCPSCAMNRRLGGLCLCAEARPLPFEAIRSVFDYDETVSALLHHIKYRGKKSLAFDLARAAAESGMVPPACFDGVDALLPMPLHPARHRQRGFNQARYIALGFASASGLPVIDKGLRRTRKTPSQTRLNKRQRRRNMAGAFGVPEAETAAIFGKRLVLVDDVVTTAATTAAAAQALLDAGAASVRVLSLARD